MIDKVLVCGSRDWTETPQIAAVLKTLRFTNGPFIVIHGAARGADTLAAEYAARIGLEVIPFPGDWKRYGKRAGYVRNVQMADEKPSLVVAFQRYGSPGTQMMIDIATERGIDVLVFSEAS